MCLSLLLCLQIHCTIKTLCNIVKNMKQIFFSVLMFVFHCCKLVEFFSEHNDAHLCIYIKVSCMKYSSKIPRSHGTISSLSVRHLMCRLLSRECPLLANCKHSTAFTLLSFMPIREKWQQSNKWPFSLQLPPAPPGGSSHTPTHADRCRLDRICVSSAHFLSSLYATLFSWGGQYKEN